MIYLNGINKTTSIHYKNKDITKVYKGYDLVWELNSLIISCYANGYWIDDYPWTDDTPWKDNIIN